MIISTARSYQHLTGTSADDFARYPDDEYHGFVGKQLVIASGGQLVGLIKQGIVSISMNTRPVAEPVSPHLQLGFSELSLMVNAVQPLTQALNTGGFGEIDAVVYDTTSNRALFLLQNAPGPTADTIIGYQLETGFHRVIVPPGGLRCIAEVSNGGESNQVILASDANGQIWQLLADADVADQLPAPVIVTQALPTPEQIGVELRNTQKAFRQLWLEGTHLEGWVLDWSLDGGLNFKPPTPLPVVAGLNGIGDEGTQIVFRLRWPVASGPVPSRSMLSYMKLDYDVVGRTQA